MFKKKLQIYMMWQEHHEQQEGKESRIKIIKRWIWEHNKYIAAVVAVVVFSGLLALVIYDIETKNDSSGKRAVSIIINESGHGSKIEGHSLETTTFCGIAGDRCTIECKNTNIENLAEQINLIQLRGCSGTSFLSLEEISFQRTKFRIDTGWLNETTTSFHQLKFRKCDLQDLGPSAFAGHPFTSLKYLTLDQTDINVLKKYSFLNTSLSNLEIKFDAFTPITIEEEVFEGLSGTLQVLQMEQCLDSSGIQNVVGTKSAPLLNIKQLYFDCNNLGNVAANSFMSATTVEDIRLTSSLIAELDVKTFRNLYRLQTLSLTDNVLTTIPEGVFDSISQQSYTAIYVDQNPWNCDCNLEWLKDFCIDHGNMCMNGFECRVGSDEINYLDAIFCPNGSTPSPYTTTTTTEHPAYSTTESYVTTESESTPSSITKDPTEATTDASNPTTDSSNPEEPNVISIECRNGTITKNSDRGTPQTMTVRLNTVELEFFQVGDNPMFEIIIKKGDVSEDVILVFDPLDKTKHSCTMNLNNHTLVHDLNHGKTYTLCLMPNNATEVSPFDCTGLTVPPEWGARAWIPNKSMSVVISAICGCLLAIILVSSLIMFYCIRQHPNLIKGNKRVIIVESKAADAIVMPKNYDQLNYVPPSLHSYSDGYLTPKQEFYVHDGHRKVVLPMLPTISERSSFAASTSRVRRSHIRRRAKLEQVAQAFDDHFYEQPPPLPPNHPCGDRRRRVNYTYI